MRGDSDRPERGEEIIEGFLRDGEVCLLVAASKDGKSWMAGQLARCIATGTPFLGLNVKQGSVLLIDNELKQREIDFRHSQIAKALQHHPKPGEVTVVCRRGKSSDVMLLASKIKKMDLSGYSLIVIDALYKIIPEGRSENDNEAMGKLMNVLQNIADETGVPIVIVHHTTKGDQSNKSTLDLAAGAGSFGRSLDALIAIRDHETEGHNVCEFKTRTNKPMESVSVKFEWPLWYATTLPAEIRKAGGNAEQQRKKDAEADALVLKTITDAKLPLSKSEIRGKTGMGPDRVTAIVDTREQLPLCLDPLRVQTGTLDTGDYALLGCDHIRIERKSLEDLLGCVGRDHERFDRELQRLLAYPVRVLLVEATWAQIEIGEWRSKIKPEQAIGSLLGWQAMGLSVHLVGDHERAGRHAARLLFTVAKRRYRELRTLIAEPIRCKENG